MKKKLLTTVIGAALAVGGPAAFAVDAKLSGQVNRAIMWADDGKNSETHHVDGQPSGSRFRFVGSEDIGAGIKAGIYWEMGFQSQGSHTVSQTNRNGTAASLAERHQYVFFQGAFGKFSSGQTEGAAKGIAGMDLSGTDLFNNNAPDFGAAVVFRTSAGGTGPSIGDVISSPDESRYDVARYDSPSLGGLVLTATTGQKSNLDIVEVAARYTADFGAAGKIAAGVGRSEKETTVADTDEEITGASLSYLFPFGLNLTYGQIKRDKPSGADREGKWAWVKVGYKAGNHAVSVDMSKGEDQTLVGDEAEWVGFGYNYASTKSVDLYGGMRVYSLDRPGSEFEDIKIVTVGSRIKF